MSISKWLALDKLSYFTKSIKDNGGIFKSVYTFYITDDLKDGTLVGEDKYGNKYYENDRYFLGKNRWVRYNPNVHLEYEGSMVPAEWFGWLHNKTDFPPTVKPPVKYRWMIDHENNTTATKKAYVPYSTTKPKIESWTPGK